MPKQTSDGTASLDKALDVLDAVGQAPEGLSQADIAAQLKLPRTTAYRLLATLVGRGLLRRDPLRRVYCLGSRCFEYARAAYAMPDLVAAAGAELRALRDMTGETTYLAALDGHEVVSLERVEGAHSQRSRSVVGQRKPLHCTSQGKAILAALPPETRDRIVRELPLTAQTPRTITDRRRLLAELRLTATRGYSIDDEEIVPGVRCCGAPIVDAHGQVRGAISVAGPTFRLSSERVELLGPEVADAARRIGAQLSAAQPSRADGEARPVPGEWAFCGAHPCWSPEANLLYWADALAPTVHAATPDRDRVVAQADAPIDALLAHRDGAALHAEGRWLQMSALGRLKPLASLPRRRISSVCVGADGLVWGCVQDGERWRIVALSHDGRGAGGWRLPEPATALAWGGRDTLMIACEDSGTLYSAQVGSASLRRLTTVPKGSGRVAGVAVEQGGALWCALRGGWSVVRFEPDGTLDRVIALPVATPTDVAFGGKDGRTLFITTAREAVTREALDAAPLSGRLFVLDDAGDGVIAPALRSDAD